MLRQPDRPRGAAGVADTVICMEAFAARDVTTEAHAIDARFGAACREHALQEGMQRWARQRRAWAAWTAEMSVVGKPPARRRGSSSSSSASLRTPTLHSTWHGRPCVKLPRTAPGTLEAYADNI